SQGGLSMRRGMTRLWATVALAAATLDCGHAPSSGTPVARRGQASAPPEAGAPGAPDASGALGPQAAADAAAAAAGSGAPGRFPVGLQSNADLPVLAGNGALVYGRAASAIVRGDEVLTAKDHPFGHFQPGAVMGTYIQGAFGRWPDEAYLSKAHGSSECRCGC